MSNTTTVKRPWLLYLLVMSAIFATLGGCTRERSVSTLPDAHPDEWINPDSPDFHGEVTLSTGLAGCRECHGDDYDGGKTRISCIECHGQIEGFCTACHGGVHDLSGAPPYSLNGDSSATSLGVGAHQLHLGGGEMSGGFSCTTCHHVPAFALQEGHYDLITSSGLLITDSIAELSWGQLVGSSAVWNRATATCSSIYCHGNFTGGDPSNNPIWTASNQAQCGSCHDVGVNPETLGWRHAYHVGDAGLGCNECHSGVVSGDLTLVDKNLHVNGAVEISIADSTVCDACHGGGSESCTLCHGGTDNNTGSPPLGLRNETATSELAVGAHTVHMDGGTQSVGISCSECHIVPTGALDIGHFGADSIAEMTFGPLAGVASSWNRASATCNSTYCHGDFTGGNQTNAPIWTGSNQAQCGSCHDIGQNPAMLGWKHVLHVRSAGLDCRDCHSATVDDNLDFVDLSLHVNGVTDTLTWDADRCDDCHGANPSCTACHGGTDNTTGAPPVALNGEISNLSLGVGAHTRHMDGGSTADGFTCSECHIVPAIVTSPGHLDADSVAEVNWGPLAGGGGSWNRGTGVCSNIYCHGEFAGGDQTNNPLWTSGTTVACGSCHDNGSAPWSLSGEHDKHVRDKNVECYECHSTVVNAVEVIIGRGLHVDGNLQVSFSSGDGTYSDGTCSNIGCHDTESWIDNKNVP